MPESAQSLDSLLRRCATDDYSVDLRVNENSTTLFDNGHGYPLRAITSHAETQNVRDGDILEDAYVSLRRFHVTLQIIGDAPSDETALGQVLKSLYDALLQRPKVISHIKNVENAWVPLSAPLCLIGAYDASSSFVFSMQGQRRGDELLERYEVPVERFVEKHGKIAVYLVKEIPRVLLHSPSALKEMLRTKFGEIMHEANRSGISYYPVLD